MDNLTNALASSNGNDAPVNAETLKRFVLRSNPREINAACTGLDIVTNAINETIESLRERNLLAIDELSDAIVRELSQGDADSLCKAISVAYDDESRKFKIPFVKWNFKRSASAPIREVEECVKKMHQRIQDEFKAKFLKYEDGIQYPILDPLLLFAQDGKAAYSKDAVKEHFTEYADGEYALDFLKRAKELHRMMAEFDREVLLLSGGAIKGVTDSVSYKEGVIEAVDGILYLDLNRLYMLDFANAETLLKSDKNFQNSKVVEVEE